MQTEVTKLHVVPGELSGRTFDIVTKRADGSVITYVACDVVKEIAWKVAAAPEMYEALSEIERIAKGGADTVALLVELNQAARKASAALSKARGEA